MRSLRIWLILLLNLVVMRCLRVEMEILSACNLGDVWCNSLTCGRVEVDAGEEGGTV